MKQTKIDGNHRETEILSHICHKSMRDLDEKHGGIVLPKRLQGRPNNITKFVKYFQCPVFYERELKLWCENRNYKGLPLQLFLFQNRLEYLGKSPKALSDMEILRGFGIAGILNSYTRYDTTVLDKLLMDYHCTSVYDPCAGWGERMVCCLSRNVKYYGIDVNEKLFTGYQDMLTYLDVKPDMCFMQIGNAAEIDVSDIQADVVFTCPPYYNVELYTENGAENLSYADFLLWWDKVVKNSLNVHPSYFMFQMNQKYKQDMLDVVLQNDFVLVEERIVPQRSSHKTRSANGQNRKKEYESVMICKRA